MAIKCEVRDSHSRTNHAPHPERNVRQLAKARSESVVSWSDGSNAVHTYGSLSLSEGEGRVRIYSHNWRHPCNPWRASWLEPCINRNSKAQRRCTPFSLRLA